MAFVRSSTALLKAGRSAMALCQRWTLGNSLSWTLSGKKEVRVSC